MRSGPAVELPTASLHTLEQGVEDLARCADLDLPTERLTELVRETFTLRNRLDAALTGLVGRLDERMRAEQDPDDPSLSCAAWLREELRMNNGAAWGQVRLARQLRDLPSTRVAFAGGVISSQHAMAITRTVDRVVAGGGRAADAEGPLLREAMGRSPYDLLRWGRHLRHRLNPEEVADEEEQAQRRRWLHLTQNPWDGGYELEAHLDAEAGTRLKVALQGVLGPRRKGDDRPAPVRRADGFDELVTKVLDSGELPVRGGQRPHITVTATLETLRGDPGAPAAELDFGWPISGAALRRIACDAELTPILLGAEGNPLYVGRKRRTASPRMRKALALRDQTCVWERCDRPPTWCSGHHRRLWVEGGGTNVDEMDLLCTLHHTKYHRGYRLRRAPDGRVEEVPPEPTGPVFGPAIHAPPPAA
jgi:hypothetical protein